MLPTFKEVVEELFVRGLVKAVFATETLALGINMPARSVVLERLVKWNGEAHADLTPGEYTQLTGRAGRRGIDVEGHAVVVWAPGWTRGTSPGWPRTRTYPLRSQLPARRTTWRSTWSASSARTAARELLESSFAQFQADRSVVGLARQVQRNEEALERLRARRCPATSATSRSTRGCAGAIGDRETALARQGAAQRRAAAADVAGAAAGRATSSGCRPGGGPGSRSCSTRASAGARRARGRWC